MTALLLASHRPAADTPLPAPVPLAVSHPLHASLRELAAREADRMAADFVERLDSALLALAAESHNVAETRAVLDLHDALQMGRASLMRGLSQAFVQRLDPLQPRPVPRLIDFDRLSVLPSDELEETIALAHLAQQAERLVGDAGRRLRGRLTWASRGLGLPALAQAFEAGVPGHCFATVFRELGLEPAQRLLAYRLVESHALPLWPAVLDAAQQLLDRHGLGEPLVAGIHDAPPLLVAEPSLQCLRAIAGRPVGDADADLAERLLTQCQDGGPALSAVAAAGQWLDSLLAEPQLPGALLPDLETLRFPLLKAAVCDPAFFTNPGHGLRRSINAVAEHFALAGAKGLMLAPLRAELRELLEQIAISGAFARDLLPHCEPLAAEELTMFFDQQRQEEQARGESLLMMVRCQVAREVEEQILGSELPTAGTQLVSGGFLPLIASARLQHGAGSREDREARALLEEFTDSFRRGIDDQEREQLVARIRDALLAAGLREDRVGRLIEELDQAYGRLETRSLTSAAARDDASVEEIDALLSALVPPQAAYGMSTPLPPPRRLFDPPPALGQAASIGEPDDGLSDSVLML